MNKKRGVLVGLGYHGVNVHVPAFKESKRAELVGVMSSDSQDVEQYSKEFGVQGFVGFAQCLDTIRPDFVSLAVYHNQYLPLVKEAAKRGVHILYEKPFGFDLDQAKEMVKIAKEAKILIQVGVQRRFSPDFSAFAHQVSKMHDKYFFEINYAVGFQSPHSGWRGKREIAGGGSIMDFGYHVLDVILWNFGLPSKVIAEMSWKARPDKIYDTEDTVAMLLRYKRQEFYGNVILSRVLPRKEYYKVVGSKEVVEYDNGVVRVSTIGGEILTEEDKKVSKVEVTTREIDYLCDVIDNKVKAIATAKEHVEHMAFISALYESEREGKYIDPRKYL